MTGPILSPGGASCATDHCLGLPSVVGPCKAASNLTFRRHATCPSHCRYIYNRLIMGGNHDGTVRDAARFNGPLELCAA